MTIFSATIASATDFPVGAVRLLAAAATAAAAPDLTASPLPELRVGDVLDGEGLSLRVLESCWLTGSPSRLCWRLEVLESAGADGEPTGPVEFSVRREGFALAWITLSDKGAAGLREDESGPLVGRLVAERLALRAERGFLLPDEEGGLRSLLGRLALEEGYDLIVTTGGTGVAPRDVTPEATLRILDKRLAGFERAMTAASLAKTPFGAGSRAVAGTVGRSLMINLPGSPRAVAECLEPILPILLHTLEKLHGDPADCADVRLTPGLADHGPRC